MRDHKNSNYSISKGLSTFQPPFACYIVTIEIILHPLFQEMFPLNCSIFVPYHGAFLKYFSRSKQLIINLEGRKYSSGHGEQFFP